jgi:hypothetical protein
MSYRRLFLFVEGDWDQRFFQKILEPALRRPYDHVDYVRGVRRDHPRYGMLSFAQLSDSDGINKEAFEAALVAKESSPFEARLALLESFDLELARERNRSLRYFVDKIPGA